MERWKIVEDYPDYIVSNYGRVKSFKRLKPKILSLRHHPDGYVSVYLGIGIRRQKNYRLGRLVAKAFIPNPNNYPEVNHKDGNKENNKASNLEWCSKSRNCKHSFEIGIHIPSGTPQPGSRNGMSKLTEKDIPVIRKMLKDKVPSRMIAKRFGLRSASTISAIKLNKTWTHVT